MSRPAITPEQIDAILPQTQCGLCGYPGCMPYATALSKQRATMDLCPPGGVAGLQKIAALLGADPEPYIAAMQEKAKPSLVAVIREAECIGCTKCIQACPVDAILGSGKWMHTVIAAECTGCELCVAPCPVDCIDMVAIAEKSPDEKQQQANLARTRYHARQKRLAPQQPKHLTPTVTLSHKTMIEKKAFIEAAVLRAKMKKSCHPERSEGSSSK